MSQRAGKRQVTATEAAKRLEEALMPHIEEMNETIRIAQEMNRHYRDQIIVMDRALVEQAREIVALKDEIARLKDEK